MRASLGLVLVLIAIATATAYAANTPIVPRPSEGALSDLVKVIGASVVTGFVALFLQFLQSRSKLLADYHAAQHDRELRQNMLGLRIVDAIKEDPGAARRFAVGMLKVMHICHLPPGEEGELTGTTQFVPVNSRITLGRDEGNDIYLYEKALDHEYNRVLSRFHCGFVTDKTSVRLEDYHSRNGTFVSSAQGEKTLKIDGKDETFRRVEREHQLVDGDLVWVDPFVLRFRTLKPSEALLQ